MELGMITLEDYDKYLRNKKTPFQDDFGIQIIKRLLRINIAMYEE